MKLKRNNISVQKLIDIIKKLRSPNGCDWDQRQTHTSLIPYLLEETYEVIEAIENNNYNDLKEELGDLLLHVLFQAELSSENNKFNIEDCINMICEKLVRRHPYIFSNNDSDNQYTQASWELSKKKEKNRESILDGVPNSLPKLLKANRIQEKASSVGFDWNDAKKVIEKVDEEIDELKESIFKNSNIDEELGDVLFSIVNLSRHLKINPEESLNKAINKFSTRFKKIEKDLKNKDINMQDLNLSELDDIWNYNKKNEK